MTSVFKSVRFVWILLLLQLTACGFQLRGAFELPAALSSVYIDARSSTPLLQDLILILKTNGASVIDDATLATSTIKIEKEESSQRVISVDSSGRAREYELSYNITFSVSAAIDSEHQKVMIDSRKLELIRDYVYDSAAVLGKSREKNILLRDMQRDASRLIMLQIQAAYRKNTAAPAVKTNNTETKN